MPRLWGVLFVSVCLLLCTGTNGLEAGEGVKFPEQSWTYKDVKSPPKWLVPKQMLAPGLPITKPPPVPQMIPPPPPFPRYAGYGYGHGGQGGYVPPPPTYSLPHPPPHVLPRWIPWTAYYKPTASS